MKRMTAYRLKKDTIGYKAGEVFVKMPDGRLFDCSRTSIACDINVEKIEKTFSEWFEEGEIEVPYFPEQGGHDYFFIRIDQVSSKMWSTVFANGEDMERIISWNCFPTKEMAEKALKKIKKPLHDFWLEQENGTSEEDTELVFHQKEKE